jgi:hypothetical protein
VSAKTFNIIAILGVLFLYAITGHLDHPMQDPKVKKDGLLRTALDSAQDDVIRSTAAQEYCGNAGWKFSEKPFALVCIPRHGKPYTAKPDA